MIIKKKTFLMIALLLLSQCLSACSQTPEQDYITSKKENALEDAINDSSGGHEQITVDNSTFHSFSAEDGKVLFDFDSSETSIPGVTDFPVLQVTPHYFTEEETRRIAQAICGENEIYEYTDSLTKAEIETRILRLRQWLDPDYLYEYYQGDEETIARVSENFRSQLSALEQAYSSAPAELEPQASDFTYHPDTYWHSETTGIEGNAGLTTMIATSFVDGIPYYMTAAKRNDEEYRLSAFSAFIYDEHTRVYNEYAFCQTKPFSDEEIETAIERMQKLIDSMNIGTWRINNYYVTEMTIDNNSNRKIYELSTTWQHLYEEIPLAVLPQLGSLRHSSKEDERYSPDYYYESLEMRWSNDTLISFFYTSPVDVVKTNNQNVYILPADEAVSLINQQLSFTYTSSALLRGILPYPFLEKSAEFIHGTITIQKVELSFIRLRIQNNPEDFYLLPAWTVWGIVQPEEYVLNGDRVIIEKPNTIERELLLCINAIDGSVIDISKGY